MTHTSHASHMTHTSQASHMTHLSCITHDTRDIHTTSATHDTQISHVSLTCFVDMFRMFVTRRLAAYASLDTPHTTHSFIYIHSWLMTHDSVHTLHTHSSEPHTHEMHTRRQTHDMHILLHGKWQRHDSHIDRCMAWYRQDASHTWRKRRMTCYDIHMTCHDIHKRPITHMTQETQHTHDIHMTPITHMTSTWHCAALEIDRVTHDMTHTWHTWHTWQMAWAQYAAQRG